jgi:hypothetical protein
MMITTKQRSPIMEKFTDGNVYGKTQSISKNATKHISIFDARRIIFFRYYQ